MDRIKSFDFTRVMCTLGIAILHFSAHTNSNFQPLRQYKNGTGGGVLVTIFFILSGAVIYLNNNNISLKIFYYKRWKSIFPTFYIAFFTLFTIYVIQYGRDFLEGKHLFILSLLGLDGYFAYEITTFSLIGEWFLGAIVLCYIAFPIIIYFNKKNDFCVLIFLVLSYMIIQKTDFFVVEDARNILTCLLKMEIGYFLIKKDLWKNKICIFISTIGTVIAFGVSLAISVDTANMLLGLFMFVVLSFIGSWIMKNTFLSRLFVKLSGYSYAFFLLHHRVIYFYFRTLNYENSFYAFLVLLLIILTTFTLAILLTNATKKILKSNLYLEFEKKLLEN